MQVSPRILCGTLCLVRSPGSQIDVSIGQGEDAGAIEPNPHGAGSGGMEREIAQVEKPARVSAFALPFNLTFVHQDIDLVGCGAAERVRAEDAGSLLLR